MNYYLSRGELRPCRTRDAGISNWSEKKKDVLADLILKLVGNLAKDTPLSGVPEGWEPTGLGYLDDDVRDFVMKRSA